MVDTTNDEAIARALEREDSSRVNARPPGVVVVGRPLIDCPHGGLQPTTIEWNQIFDCERCRHSLNAETDRHYYGCTQCQHRRVCEQCYRGTPRSAKPPPSPRRGPPMMALPPQPAPPHMCCAPCIIGDLGICMELLVDTGASVSVMSIELANQLSLQHLIDHSVRGTASGVGQAQIVGKLYNVLVVLGQVEFRMDFAILGGTPEKLLLLGLDLMRQYKCIVDLESDVLIFGGKDGVQVPLLPADEQQERAFRNAVEGCSIM